MVSVDYLRGFIDGEGSFMIRLRTDKRYGSGMNIEPRFNITQKNLKILQSIKKQLEMGNICFHKRDQLWHYNIYRVGDLFRFAKMVKDGLYVKKEMAERFYECLFLMKKKKHLSKEGAKKIYNLWIVPKTVDKPG